MHHRRIEEMALNAWPALQTVVDDGWLLRFANGFTFRSNSISPLYYNGKDVLEKIRSCERLYFSRNQDVIFKMTPFVSPSGLDDTLDMKRRLIPL